MKRMLALTLSLMMIFGALAGCGNANQPAGSPSSGGASTDDVITFSIASGVVNQESFQQTCCEVFAEKVAELSGGKLVCEVLAGNSVGGERELCESLQLGTMEMCYTSDIGINSSGETKPSTLSFNLIRASAEIILPVEASMIG